MFSSKLLLALAFSVIGVRADSQTCTFVYVVPTHQVPADPATSIDTAIAGGLSELTGSSEVTVTSTVTPGDGFYSAVVAMTIPDQSSDDITSFAEELAGQEITDGTITYIVSYVDDC